MKIQCSCGAKYEFDLTPQMRTNPVSFVCPACGGDASQFVDDLVRRELGQASAPAGTPVSVLSGSAVKASAPQGVRLNDSAPSPAQSAMRLQAPTLPPEPPVAAPEASLGVACLKHPGQVATEKCYVCYKPICPKCMQLFGYVCSPLCKAKAESRGINIPIYTLQKSIVEARQWRKVVLVSSAVGLVLFLVLGVWFWYAWFGCLPRTTFSVTFPDRAYSGQSAITGKDHDQLVFLHGDTLARYEVKEQDRIWSVHVLDREKFKQKAQDDLKSMATENSKILDNGGRPLRIPSPDEVLDQLLTSAEEEMTLYVRGQNIWIASPGKIVRYDWATGQQNKVLTVQAGFGGVIARGDELTMVDSALGKPMVTRINLVTCESSTEDLSAPEAQAIAAAGATPRHAGQPDLAGLPTVPGRDMGKPLDPGKVAEQAQHLSLAARIALPATLGNAMTQERTLAAMDDSENSKPASTETGPGSTFSVIPSKDGFLEFSSKVLERRIVQRDAMKAAPQKSALEGNVSAGNSLQVANQFLNEMQRQRGGEMVEEDLSRYQVTLRRPGTQESWTGEVVGPPKLFPLDTINVLTADKQLIVFDTHFKKLWQATLAFSIVRGLGALDADTATYGQGPCVEHKGSLYVFDQGVLTAFDLATGNVRWRLPSVGIAGLFFDDEDNLYVNTTTASPDTIKYSRQIDISDKVRSVVMKVASSNGKILWSVEPGGLVNYIYGKVVLVAQSYQPPDEDTDGPAAPFMTPAHLRIRRISARNGHEIWEYFQQRAPLDIEFDKNTIRLVFRKEVDVLKYATF